MPRFDITTGLQTVTTTGAVTGVLDTSVLSATSDFTIEADITGLTAGATARVVIEDTANATEFSDASSVAVFDVAGQVAGIAEQNYSVRRYQVPSLTAARFGVTHSQLRANVQQLTGTSPSVSLHVYLVQ